MQKSIINELKKAPGPEITDGQELLELARGWLRQGNPIVAIELLKAASGSADVEHDRELLAHILKETGRAMMMQSDWEQAESCYLSAQRSFLEVENFKGAAECARNRANTAFQQGDYATAERLCQEGLEWASFLGDHELRATILNTLGAVKSATGEQREAVKMFELCLADFRASGNLIRQGYVLLNIGLSRTELGEFDRAVESLNEALRIAFSERDLHLVEICYQNIARCHLAQNELKLAKAVSDTAHKVLPGLNSPALEVELNVIDARILRSMGDIDSTEKLLEKTLQLTIDNNLNQLQADVLFEQGKLYKQRGEYALAEYKFDSAADCYRRIGAEKDFREVIRELGNLKNSRSA